MSNYFSKDVSENLVHICKVSSKIFQIFRNYENFFTRGGRYRLPPPGSINSRRVKIGVYKQRPMNWQTLPKTNRYCKSCKWSKSIESISYLSILLQLDLFPCSSKDLVSPQHHHIWILVSASPVQQNSCGFHSVRTSLSWLMFYCPAKTSFFLD